MRKLGHPTFTYLLWLYPKLCIHLDSSELKYEVCKLAKNHCVPYSLSNKTSEVPFSIVQIDVWGLSGVIFLSRARWFISFIDGCNRTTWVYQLKGNFETIPNLQNFFKMIQTQFDVQVQVIKSSNGTKYFNESLSISLKMTLQTNLLCLWIPSTKWGG